jgi:hypothetical protein
MLHSPTVVSNQFRFIELKQHRGYYKTVFCAAIFMLPKRIGRVGAALGMPARAKDANGYEYKKKAHTI